MEFEWDRYKATTNERKHGVAFSEAITVFGDSLELTILNPDHSSGEFRFLSIGKSTSGNLLLVSYTERHGLIRIISARRATSKEYKYYEQNQ